MKKKTFENISIQFAFILKQILYSNCLLERCIKGQTFEYSLFNMPKCAYRENEKPSPYLKLLLLFCFRVWIKEICLILAFT